MPDKYSEDDEKAIGILVDRMFNKAKKCGYSYRQLASVVRAKSHVTVWRWMKGRSTPSKHHVYHIKVFLGYSVK